MIAILTTLWQFRTLIAAGVGLIGILGTFGVQEWRVRGLRADLGQAQAALADATTRYELCAERLKGATRDLEMVGKVNRANVDTLDKIRADHQAQIEALSRELAAAPKILTLEKVIHAKAKECSGGVPPAIRAVPQWLRDNPEPAVGGPGGADRGQGNRDRAPASPGRSTPLQPGTRTTG